jgi:raffinose/stachyose/melibiose transport system permease protein
LTSSNTRASSAVTPTAEPGTPARRRRPPRRTPPRRRRATWTPLLWALPALAVYGAFVLYPLVETVEYSFYNWDGIGAASPAGFSNYQHVFTQPALYTSILNSFMLIVFFTVIPVILGLVSAVLIREIKGRGSGTLIRTLLFLPQVIPLAGASIAWTWMYSPTGVVNQGLRAVGLGSQQHPWLGDFSTALPAVGIIGTWVLTGFCTVLLLVGTARIDPSLFEAARLDGAGRWAEFRAITLPGLRREIVVCVTVTVISALASFDVVYIATQGGPGYSTMVPGLEIYQLTFIKQSVGQASALAVVLVALVLIVILPIQRLGRAR